MPRPGRHGPPLYPAYLVGVNIWNNLVFGNLGRWCTNQHFKDPNSSSYWPPRQLFHLLQSGDSFTSCSLLDSVSSPLEAIWQRGASSPWPFPPCATGKQWQTWFHWQKAILLELSNKRRWNWAKELEGNWAGRLDGWPGCFAHQNRSGFVAIFVNCVCFENNFRAIFATIHVVCSLSTLGHWH